MTASSSVPLSEQAQIAALRAEVEALKAQVATLKQRQDHLPLALFNNENCSFSGWRAVDPRNPTWQFLFCGR